MPASSLLGVDLGGTKTTIVRFDAATWQVQARQTIPTRAAEGWEVVLDDLCALVATHRDVSTRGVGVGVPGLLRQPEGHLLVAPNIPGARDVPLRTLLRERLGLPVAVENDARSFALAEALHGAARGHRVVVGITLGTGVGGGIVIDGKVFHGVDGSAGEIGHMLLVPGVVPYPSDLQRGEVEQYLSGTALRKRCAAAESPADIFNGERCSFLHPQVFRETAWLVTSLVSLLNPGVIVFGGSAGRALMGHLSEVVAEVQQWLLPGTPMPLLVPAELEEPGALGAALGAAEL
jgi:glucokinase